MDTGTDIYWNGLYHSSHPSELISSLTFDDHDTVRYFLMPDAENVAGRLTLPGKTICDDLASFIVQTDRSLFLKNGKGDRIIPLHPIISASVDRICSTLDTRQQQAGFFRMSPDQKASASLFLSTAILDLASSPKVLSIPVNGWYNYAEMEESAIDESAVLNHLTIGWQTMSEDISAEIAAQLSQIPDFEVPAHMFVRSHIIRKALKRV
jgi:hypothetical protein